MIDYIELFHGTNHIKVTYLGRQLLRPSFQRSRGMQAKSTSPNVKERGAPLVIPSDLVTGLPNLPVCVSV